MEVGVVTGLLHFFDLLDHEMWKCSNTGCLRLSMRTSTIMMSLLTKA